MNVLDEDALVVERSDLCLSDLRLWPVGCTHRRVRKLHPDTIVQVHNCIRSTNSTKERRENKSAHLEKGKETRISLPLHDASETSASRRHNVTSRMQAAVYSLKASRYG